MSPTRLNEYGVPVVSKTSKTVHQIKVYRKNYECQHLVGFHIPLALGTNVTILVHSKPAHHDFSFWISHFFSFCFFAIWFTSANEQFFRHKKLRWAAGSCAPKILRILRTPSFTNDSRSNSIFVSFFERGSKVFVLFARHSTFFTIVLVYSMENIRSSVGIVIANISNWFLR